MLCGFSLAAIGLFQLIGNPTGTSAEYPLYAVGLILLAISILLVPFTVLKFYSIGISRKAPFILGTLTATRTKLLLASFDSSMGSFVIDRLLHRR